MREDVRFTIKIGAIVLLTAIIGLGVFLYFGSSAGVYALLVGIPAVIFGSAVVYARRSSPAASPEASHYFEREAQNVAERMRTLLQQYDRLAQQLEGWEPADIEDEIAYALEGFEDAGVEFDRASNRFAVVGTDDLREIERLDDQIDDLRTKLTDAATRHVSNEGQACREAQANLESAELIEETRTVPEPDPADPEDLIQVIEDYNNQLAEALEEAIETLRAIAETNDHAGDAVDHGAGTARSALNRGDYGRVAEVLIETQTELERGLSTDFEMKRDELDTLLDTVTSSVVSEYVDPRLVEDVEAVQGELSEIDTALELADLRELSDHAQDCCTEMVQEMSDTLADHMKTLSTASVPEDFYAYQSANDEAYVSQLQSTDGLEAFRRGWLTAVGELSSALESVEEKAAVAGAYDPVSDQIEETLQTSGRTETSDLKVKQPEQFMKLFAAETNGVTYEPSTPALVADDYGETHGVTVRAGFNEGGPERSVSVSLDGSALSDTKTFQTHLLDVVTFNDVLYGEYTLTVSTEEDGYEAIERSVVVEEGLEVEALLAEQPLQESVCDGIDEAARDALNDADSLFTDRYEEAEYLSESIDLPMSDEYVPCMLVLWAEREGLTARQVDGEVLVYDGDQFANRLSNIVEHNISTGESMSYEKIRNRYLSVPATRELITETVQNSEVASEIECGSQQLTKH